MSARFVWVVTVTVTNTAPKILFGCWHNNVTQCLCPLAHLRSTLIGNKAKQTNTGACFNYLFTVPNEELPIKEVLYCMLLLAPNKN